jgi:hypothetical protein
MKRALEGKNSVLSPTIERSGLYEKSIELILNIAFYVDRRLWRRAI